MIGVEAYFFMANIKMATIIAKRIHQMSMVNHTYKNTIAATTYQNRHIAETAIINKRTLNIIFFPLHVK